jgi:hypothetical protein
MIIQTGLAKSCLRIQKDNRAISDVWIPHVMPDLFRGSPQKKDSPHGLSLIYQNKLNGYYPNNPPFLSSLTPSPILNPLW